MLNITRTAGFDLHLDLSTFELTSTESFFFSRTTRKARDLRFVLRSWAEDTPNTDIYYIYYLDHAPADAESVLERYALTYSPVALPPQTIHGEFVKTAGHYHPLIPGAKYSYPEVYTQLYGQLYLLLQQRDRNSPDTPLDCVLVEMTPGVTVMIPPEYAHILVNPTTEVALMAGLYNKTFMPDYDEVREHRGLAYYLVNSGELSIEPNAHYRNVPSLKRLCTLTDSVFAPPDPEVPLWTGFIRSPNKYAFLSDKHAVETYFNPRPGTR